MTDIHESLKPLAVSIDSLTPDPSNARKHDKRNIEAIKASLARFGQTKPIVLHSNGTTIIAGNGTWHAAKELGWTHIAAAKTNLDTAEAVAYGIADNKTAELAEWEDDTLRDLMDALPDDLKLATGFEGDEIAEMLRLPSDEVHEDEVPPVPSDPTTKQGDIWLLGDHRLLCGNSLSNEAHAFAKSKLIDAVFTDPPYGMDAVRSSGVLKDKYRHIIGDENTNTAVDAVAMWTAPKMVWWGANYFANALEPSACWLVWDKNNGGSDQMDAELAWTNFSGVSRMFTQASEKVNRIHPTQKPVSLLKWVFDRWLQDCRHIVDPFTGSGSTLIACEQAGKEFSGVEMDEGYCDAVVQRWENLTGKKAERVPAEVGDASTVES